MNSTKRIRFQVILSVFWCFASINLLAQNSKIQADSLKRVLLTAEGKDLIKAQYQLSSYLATIDLEVADSLAQQALALSDSLDFEEGKIYSSLAVATILSIKGEYKPAEEMFRTIIEKSKEVDMEMALLKAYTGIGAFYTRRGEYNLAIENQLMALQLSEKLSMVDDRVTNLLNIGLIKQGLGSLEEAKEYLTRGLELSEEHDLTFRSAQFYINLGVVEFMDNNTGLSIAYNQKAAELFKNFGDKAQLAIALQNIGYAHTSLKAYDLADQFYEESIQIRREIKDLRGVAWIYRNRATLLYDLQELQMSVDQVQKGLEIAIEIDDPILRMELSEILFSAFEKLGKYDQALSYYKDFNVIKDSLEITSNKVKIAELTAKYEYEEQQRALDLKQAQLALSENEKASLVRQRAFLLAAFVLLVVVFVLVYLFNKNRLARLKVERKLSIEEKKNSETKNQLLAIKNKEMLDQVSEKELENEKLKIELEMKHKQLANHTLFLIEKNEYLNDLKNKLDENLSVAEIKKSLDKSINSNRDWGKFQEYFDKVHVDFFNRLNSEFKGLTPADIRLTTLLRLNKNTKEIATLLGISTQSVNIGRHRLRKKLGLSSEQNLNSFLTNY